MRYHVRVRFKGRGSYFIVEHTKFERYSNPKEDDWEVVGIIEKVNVWLFTPILGNAAYKGYRFGTVGEAFKKAEDYRQNE